MKPQDQRHQNSAPLHAIESNNKRREHTKYVCSGHHDNQSCMFCDGGLFACTVCGGFEGTLTTECCGRRLTEQEERLIYDVGNLDFVGGQWVKEPNFPRSNNLDHPKWKTSRDAQGSEERAGKANVETPNPLTNP